MRDCEEDYVRDIRAHFSSEKGGAARRLAAAFLRRYPRDFRARYYFAVSLSEITAGLSKAEVARNKKQTVALLGELMRTRRGLTPQQSHALENEYYWFSEQPKKQYELGLRGIKGKVPGGDYSCGVGAAMMALKSVRAGDMPARNLWSRRSLSAWKAYHRAFGERFGSVIFESIAWGSGGDLSMMEKRLRRCAALGKVPLRNHSLQWARREVFRAARSSCSRGAALVKISGFQTPIRIGRIQYRWRQIGASRTARTALVIPGGPGLSSGYLVPWCTRLARQGNLNVVLIEYPSIEGEDPMPAQAKFELLKNSLAALVKRFAKHGNPILIGHSFSCRLLLELMRTRDVQAESLVLMNCPERFDKGREFARASKRMHLPARIDSEGRFVIFWRRILPLYFGVPAKARWVRELVRDTSWMKCAWLADSIHGELAGIPQSALPPALFLHGEEDRRFPRQNAARLRKMFPRSVHRAIRNSGHFPMLEAEEESSHEVLSFLGNVRLKR